MPSRLVFQAGGVSNACFFSFQAVVHVAPTVLQQGVVPLRGEVFPLSHPICCSMIFYHVKVLAGLSHPVSRPTWGRKMGG